MKQWQFSRLKSQRYERVKPRLYVNEGKFKGRYGTYEYDSGSKITILLDDDKNSTEIAYSAIEELDEYGQPKILPVMDMTGREIVIGAHICYSVNTRHSHALEIGKVIEISKIGGIKAQAVVRNGDKVAPTSYKSESGVDSLRCIKLPVDDKTMIVWMMQEFTELVKSK